MPFKSERQRRFFYAMYHRGIISKKTLEKWERETGGKRLPERVTKKKRKTKTTRKKKRKKRSK